MRTKASHSQPAGRTLSIDELTEVSAGAAPGASATVMHNPPTYLTHNPPTYLTGRAGLAVPPDPY